MMTNFMCAILADTLSLLQESIYTEVANSFEHLQPKKNNLAGQNTKLIYKVLH